jgi:hypothetical protein
MQVLAHAYSLPKAGNTLEEYEDAFWPLQFDSKGAEEFTYAIADGATETSFSGLWARLLVEAYCDGRFNEAQRAATLLELQARWLEQVGNAPLPWYAEEKLRSGAFSSLLGLTIQCISSAENIVSVTWEAMAIGDSCLFQVSNDELVAAFPLKHSEYFNSRPILLSTNPADNEHLSDHIIISEGAVEAGDTLYLMTDALACWFLKEYEQGGKPWEIKRSSPEDFERWITKLRKDKVIRNDDVTMIRVEPLLEAETD